MVREPIRVSLLAIAQADTSALSGLYTVLNWCQEVVPQAASFQAEVVGSEPAALAGSLSPPLLQTVTGMPIPLQRTLAEVPNPEVLIVPPLFLDQGQWQTGRYPEAVAWLQSGYERGGLVCSACTGALLLAETGLLDGRTATQHWAFEQTFREHFPQVKLDVSRVLVVEGEDDRLVMVGASTSWHDLVLYLIARCAGPATARTLAKFFLLQWHSEGQAPYIIFQENTRHGDAAILSAQDWLRRHSHEAHPLDEVIERSGLPERTFQRRFRQATGHTPVHYVQHLRIEVAKQWLESGSLPVEEISWRAGYEDPAFFRRLFKRLTGLTPSAYRRRFASLGIAQRVSEPG